MRVHTLFVVSALPTDARQLETAGNKSTKPTCVGYLAVREGGLGAPVAREFHSPGTLGKG